jgi:mRNA interferase MazF
VTEQASSPRRGEIYWVDFDNSRGSEQTGRRPAVVITTDLFNSRMPVIVVAAITRKVKRWVPLVAVTLPAGRPLPHECQILVFQVRTVDKSRLTGCLGQLDINQVEELKKVMRVAWALLRIRLLELHLPRRSY